MAQYYPRLAMQHHILETRRVESLTLEAAEYRRLTWDVFLSHKSDDKLLAEDIAEQIQDNDLSVWLDTQRLPPDADGPHLAADIRRVISKSLALMAVVTDVTRESWWVPFEIGLAFTMKRYLASYGSNGKLPTFLSQWPRVRNNEALDSWCRHVHRLKGKHRPTYLSEAVRIGDSQRRDYVIDMSLMRNFFR